MKIAILLKRGPCADQADRALQTVSDMLAQGHAVRLFLLQEAVRFCLPATKRPDCMDLGPLVDKNLDVDVLTQDANLRGIQVGAGLRSLSEGPYESLVDVMEPSDRVVGIF